MCEMKDDDSENHIKKWPLVLKLTAQTVNQKSTIWSKYGQKK